MNYFIIGNGFDLSHSLKTRYTDFNEYVKDKRTSYKLSGGLDLYECLSDFYHIENIEFWTGFEESLGKHINIENISTFINTFGKEATLEIFKEFSAKLGQAFADWITFTEEEKNLSSTNKKWFYSNLFKTDDLFLSFNYTTTLEKVYNILNERINYIHNNSLNQTLDRLFGMHNQEDDQKIIFGHSEGIKTGNADIDDFIKITEKKVSEKCKSCFNYLRGYNIENIYTFGHGYGDVDYPYFKEIANILPNAKWYLYQYSENDRKAAEKMLIKLKQDTNREIEAKFPSLKDALESEQISCVK